MVGRPGAFSTAFAIGKRHVLKMTDARDGTARWFASYVKRYPNPHWPRVIRQSLTKCHTVIWMERLYPLNQATRRQATGADDLRSCCKHTLLSELLLYGELMNIDEPWQHCPTHLMQPLLDCHRQAERLGFLVDSKLSSYMRRPGGILILAGPFLMREPR